MLPPTGSESALFVPRNAAAYDPTNSSFVQPKSEFSAFAGGPLPRWTPRAAADTLLASTAPSCQVSEDVRADAEVLHRR
jgi:hypothetical protein